jgi:hypothetical protein
MIVNHISKGLILKGLINSCELMETGRSLNPVGEQVAPQASPTAFVGGLPASTCTTRSTGQKTLDVILEEGYKRSSRRVGHHARDIPSYMRHQVSGCRGTIQKDTTWEAWSSSWSSSCVQDGSYGGAGTASTRPPLPPRQRVCPVRTARTPCSKPLCTGIRVWRRENLPKQRPPFIRHANSSQSILMSPPGSPKSNARRRRAP